MIIDRGRFPWLVGAALTMAVWGCSPTVHQAKPKPLETKDPATVEHKLWDKAVTLASANLGWLPGEAHTRIEIRDSDMELEATKEIWTRLSPAPDGGDEPRVEVVRATDDGEDVTAKEKQKSKERQEKRARERAEAGKAKHEFKHPFDREWQARVKAERTGETRTVGEKACVGFRWQTEQEDGTVFRGTAWLEDKTGVPLEVQFQMDPLPDKIVALDTKVWFELLPDGRWLAKKMDVRARGRFLFITKNVNTHMEFSKHWRKDSAQKASSKPVSEPASEVAPEPAPESAQ